MKIKKYSSDNYEYESNKDDYKSEEDIDFIPKTKKIKYGNIIKKYNKIEKKYFDKLSEYDKKIIIKNEKILSKHVDMITPLRFKILNLNTTIENKTIILSKLNELNNFDEPGSGEYAKIFNWLSNIIKIPFGIYKNIPFDNKDNIEEIKTFLNKVKQSLDDVIYGHLETKEQLIRIIAQWVSCPTSNGHIIGIQGSMGVGKTKLIKEGISKAIDFPFSFISLGGLSDSSYLNGFSYTYEGSSYGKIVECLIKTKYNNPILFFDELDKISDSSKGDELVNALIHLTDSTQNDKFNDKYFDGIDIDMSKCLIFFSYNDESKINPILKDRMITINVNGYNSKDKKIIAEKYLIPDILKEFNLTSDEVIFNEDIIDFIIQNTVDEKGVRNLKRNIHNIISWINLSKYINNDLIKIPCFVNKKICSSYINKKCNDNISLQQMYL